MTELDRRNFLGLAAAGTAGWLAGGIGATRAAEASAPAANFGSFALDLLADWGSTLLKLQHTDFTKPAECGAFRCPACGVLHGRCGEATLPLLFLAQRTQRQEFLDAALRLRTWLLNVESPDGAWLNEPGAQPAWKGTTVFGAIALAEALHYHQNLLDPTLREAWMNRLRKALNFVGRNFHWNNYATVNYPVAAAYALALGGRVLGDRVLVNRGHDFALRAVEFITQPSRLLYGEGLPIEWPSPKHCVPVDLGYNVEEALPALALYALLMRDEQILKPVSAALKAHLQFLLPDGGWDNSWGTRSYKWTWWGSRTSSGCVPAYALLAKRVPEFAAAAILNLKLQRTCTHGGLLHGGPHHAQHGVPPCVQHTLFHARSLASLLAHPQFDPNLLATVLPPRATAQGLKYFPEIQVWLAAIGSWRGTVSGYDWFNTKPDQATVQATGGALGLLWHHQLGALMCASLASYVPWEPANMQKPDGPDFPLTPRVERLEGETRFTNLFDCGATINALEGDNAIVFLMQVRLLKSLPEKFPADEPKCKLEYHFTSDSVKIQAQCAPPYRLVLPLIALRNERASQPDPKTLTLARAGGTLRLEAQSPLMVEGGLAKRIFNPIPGFEAVPVIVTPDAAGRCSVTLSVT
jgi:hypothetical protein